jgi:hypothetical protein
MQVNQRSIRVLYAAALLASSVLHASDFFPLDPGNEWTYRNADTGASFKVRVGSPVFLNERIYFSLQGYTEKPILARIDERGDLVAFDEEREREELIVSFTPNDRLHWQANRRACDQEGRTLEQKTVFDGAAGPIRGVLGIQYRNFSCADTGVESEQFAENIGMLRRVTQTIAGPRNFDLAYARVGRSIVEVLTHGRFTVTLDSTRANPYLRATLRLQTNPEAPPLPLTFPSAQEYEVQLRDADGKLIWAWSDGQAFLQAMHSREVVGEWSATVMIPKPPSTGQPRAAIYTVQAWLTTAGDAPQFAATVPVTITTGLD